VSLIFKKYKQKCRASKKRPEIGKFLLTVDWQLHCHFLLTASFHGFFLSHGSNGNICPGGISVIWAFPSGFPILLKIPKGYTITFGHCPAAFLCPFSSFQQLPKSLYEHFPVVICLQFLILKIEGALENFKNPQHFLHQHRPIQKCYLYLVSISCNNPFFS
jgi:hypothetical protein